MGFCEGCGQEFLVMEVTDPQGFALCVLEPFAKLCCARYTPNGHDIEVGWCTWCCPSKQLRTYKPVGRIRRLWWRFTDMITGRYPWFWERSLPDGEDGE